MDVNFSGVAIPRPRVGWIAKAPTDSSVGETGVQRSLDPLPSFLKVRKLQFMEINCHIIKLQIMVRGLRLYSNIYH